MRLPLFLLFSIVFSPNLGLAETSHLYPDTKKLNADETDSNHEDEKSFRIEQPRLPSPHRTSTEDLVRQQKNDSENNQEAREAHTILHTPHKYTKIIVNSATESEPSTLGMPAHVRSVYNPKSEEYDLHRGYQLDSLSHGFHWGGERGRERIVYKQIDPQTGQETKLNYANMLDHRDHANNLFKAQKKALWERHQEEIKQAEQGIKDAEHANPKKLFGQEKRAFGHRVGVRSKEGQQAITQAKEALKKLKEKHPQELENLKRLHERQSNAWKTANKKISWHKKLGGRMKKFFRRRRSF